MGVRMHRCENDPGLFVTRVQGDVHESQNRVYDQPAEYAQDKHWIKFSQYDPKHHDQIRAKALKPMERLNCSFQNLTGTVSSPRGTSFL